MYNPWVQVTASASSPVPPGRMGHAAAFIESSRLLIFGGIGANGALNDLWQFEESQKLWTALSPGESHRCDRWRGWDGWFSYFCSTGRVE